MSKKEDTDAAGPQQVRWYRWNICSTILVVLKEISLERKRQIIGTQNTMAVDSTRDETLHMRYTSSTQGMLGADDERFLEGRACTHGEP